MAALHTAPDSPAALLERAEHGSECDPDQEEEEEEEIAVEEAEDEAVEELEAEAAEGQAEVEAAEGVAEVVAEEQSEALGTQEHLGCGGHTKSPGLQEKGKRKELALGGGRKRAGWEHSLAR